MKEIIRPALNLSGLRRGKCMARKYWPRLAGLPLTASSPPRLGLETQSKAALSERNLGIGTPVSIVSVAGEEGWRLARSARHRLALAGGKEQSERRRHAHHRLARRNNRHGLSRRVSILANKRRRPHQSLLAAAAKPVALMADARIIRRNGVGLGTPASGASQSN